ncbi:MAG: ATP-binding protein [Opitutales bacterium]|nr:ATP-binding protein [Opitutales bacterium]
MDPVRNPFSPGAGTPPPMLVGRQEILAQGDILFRRVLAGRSEKSMMLTGLRGVGKTVLLGVLERSAKNLGFMTIFHEAREESRVGVFLAQGLRKILLELNSVASMKERVRKALFALRNFVGTLSVNVGEFGISAEPLLGYADSGNLEADLTELLVLVGEAAQEQQKAVAIFIDEIQYFEKEEFGALIMAFHRIQQRNLPMVLVGAGLPILPALAGELKSYAERLFSFPNVGTLTREDAVKALVVPVQKESEEITGEAAEVIFKKTSGYPYFIQEWGSRVWIMTPEGEKISSDIVEKATESVIARLDESFFRVRYDRLTSGEKIFLRYMAEIYRGEPLKMEPLAKAMNKKPGTLSQVKRLLEKKGVIYAPRYGVFDFTVPLFDTFMRRVMPEFPGM